MLRELTEFPVDRVVGPFYFADQAIFAGNSSSELLSFENRGHPGGLPELCSF